jgi:hypothetical protein
MNAGTDTAKKPTVPAMIAGAPVKMWRLKKADTGKVIEGALLSRQQIKFLAALKPDERAAMGLPADIYGAPAGLPTTAQIKGVQGIWGIESAYSGLLDAASVMRIRSKSDSQKDYLFDDEGFTSAVVFFDSKEEASIELVMKSGTTEVAPGDELTLETLTFLVMDGERLWDQRGWKKLNVNATYFPNVDLTP